MVRENDGMRIYSVCKCNSMLIATSIIPKPNPKNTSDRKTKSADLKNVALIPIVIKPIQMTNKHITITDFDRLFQLSH